MELKPLDLRSYSLSFTQMFSDNSVLRENIINDIEDDFSSECKIVILEGNEGIGKTDLLLQFANKHRNTCFAYFVNTSSSFTYKQDYFMQDIGNQINFYVNPDADEQMEISDTVFSKLVFELMKLNKKNKRIYFVLDGLDQIDKSDIELLKPIIKSLPWGINSFYFIVSGDVDKLKNIVPEQAFKKSKNRRVNRFNLEEAVAFFKSVDDNADKDDIKEINDTWKGNPDWLSQVRRIIAGGISIKDFLKRDDIGEKNALLDLEWSQVGLGFKDFEDNYLKLVCIITFDDSVRDIEKISHILNCSSSLLLEFILNTSFLSIKNNEVSFVSKAYRKYVEIKLKKYDSKTSALLIAYFSEQDDLGAILSLPSLFEKNKEWSNIVSLLSPDNLGLIINNSKSFSDIKKQINYGYKASSSLKQAYNNVFRFSLYRSTVLALQKSDTREDQIKAYVALEKTDEVMDIVSNAVLKEDRLRMLIEYAKEYKKSLMTVEDYILDEIKELLWSVDFEYIRENISDIIIGLAHILPGEAVKLVEKFAGLKHEKNSLEWLLGYVASVLNNSSDSSTTESIRVSDSIKDKVNGSEFVDKFSKSIAFGLSDITSDNIINELASLDNASDRLYMVRRWIRKHKDANNILDVIEYAIELMLQDSYNVKPTSSMLLDIAYPVLFFTDYSNVNALVDRIDKLTIAINSPTADRVKLELIIIDAISKFEVEKANERVFDLYYGFIENLSDVSIKIECMSYLWAMLKTVEEKDLGRALEFIVNESEVKKDIVKNIDLLLSFTANQYKELSDTIEVISEIELDFAIAVSLKLNTRTRRFMALFLSIKTYASNPVASWNSEKLSHALSKLSGSIYYDKALVAIFDSAYEQKAEIVKFRSKLVSLIPCINTASNSSVKCYLLTQATTLLTIDEQLESGVRVNYKGLISKLTPFIGAFWDKMDIPWEKVKAGYKISSQLVKADKELAIKFLGESENVSNSLMIDNPVHASIVMESIRIMIRAYAGVLEYDKDYTYEKISSMIENASSGIEQVMLWAELAVRAYNVEAKEIAKEVVVKKIIPIIEAYKGKEDIYYHFVLTTSAPAIHLTQPEFLKLLIGNLPVKVKEAIVSSVAFVLLTKCDESDAYDDIDGSKFFDYQNAIEYINLLDFVEEDNYLYYHIKNLCYVARNNPNNFSRVQKLEITKRLSSLIKRKLPNPAVGVAHEGFAIIADACLLHFSLSPGSNHGKEYDDLSKRTAAIINAADRSYVYSILADECAIKKRKIEFISLSFDEADKILSVSEKVEYYYNALESCRKISLDIFNEKLHKIRIELVNLDDSEMFPSFRKLIDIAHKQDKNLAQKLISSLDSDPARKKVTEPASDHFAKLEMEKAVLTDYSQFKGIRNRKQMADVAWRMLGQLNAHKRVSRDVDETLGILSSASKAPILSVIPLFEFFLQNTIKSDASNAKSLVMSLYESAYSNAKLTYSMVCSLSNKNAKYLLHSNMNSQTTFVAKPGTREEAFEFIEKYLKESNSLDICLVDPYFSESDMHFLKKVLECCHKSKITVLTSCKSNSEFNHFAYSTAWRAISADEPAVHFVKACTQTKDTPFHDRYIIMADKMLGLRVGTSINSIGVKKASEISMMTADDVQSVYTSVVYPLAKAKDREYQDQVIKYETFDL